MTVQLEIEPGLSEREYLCLIAERLAVLAERSAQMAGHLARIEHHLANGVDVVSELVPERRRP